MTGLARAVGRLLRPGEGCAATGLLSDYKAPNYWLDYRSGFVRRGLPGEVLRRLMGGSPSYRQAQCAAAGLSRAAALSVVPVAVAAGRLARRRIPRAVATALLVLSPLSCPLLLHDIGRYDAVGVLVLALLAGARRVWARLPLPVGAALLAAAVAAATASEEFLLAVVAPAAAAAVARLAGGRVPGAGRRLLLLGAVLAPGAVVAALSLLVPVPPEALLTAREAASRAGVGPAGPMGDALAALDRGLIENLTFFRLFAPADIALAAVLWAGLYLLTTSALAGLLGGGPVFDRVVVQHAVVAAGLSVVAADFRRWWGLALLGAVSTVVLLEPAVLLEPVGSVDPPGWAAVVGAAVLAVAGLGLGGRKVYPSSRLRLDRRLDTGSANV